MNKIRACLSARIAEHELPSRRSADESVSLVDFRLQYTTGIPCQATHCIVADKILIQARGGHMTAIVLLIQHIVPTLVC